MAYEELVLSSSIPKIVEEFIREGVEPHLRDINAMLRLPLPEAGLEAGCNFAIAQVLLNIVSGISTTLYRQKGPSGKLFKELLDTEYWPIDPPAGMAPDCASTVLYMRGSVIRSCMR